MYTYRSLMQPKQTAAKQVHLITRVEPELADAFKAVAARAERSVAAELRLLVRARVDESNAKAEQEAAA